MTTFPGFPRVPKGAISGIDVFNSRPDLVTVEFTIRSGPGPEMVGAEIARAVSRGVRR